MYLYCNNEPKFICYHCNNKSFTKAHLMNHIQDIHLPKNSNMNTCTKCQKIFTRSSYLKIHSKTCGKSEDLKRSLMRYSCDYCDHKSNYKYHLQLHIRDKHLPKDSTLNKCSKCNKFFASSRSVKNHLRACIKNEDEKSLMIRYLYDHCDYKSGSKLRFLKHIKSKHLQSPVSNCSKCGKKYLSRSAYEIHFESCGKPKELKYSLMRFACEHCEYKTNYKAHLSKHKKYKHQPVT